MLVAGVDSSTQSTKVELRDLDTGKLAATGRAPHPPATPPVSEQDPRDWWYALVDALDQCHAYLADVAAISVAAQQHGLVLLGAHDEPLRPAKLWNDTTSAAQARQLVKLLGPRAWATACGSVPVASFTISKLAWVAENEPELLSSVKRIALPHDYLTLRLSGEHVTDRGDASGTGWYDTAAGRYRSDLFGLLAAGTRDAVWWCWKALPEVRDFDAAAGVLSTSAAAATGLRAGIPVGVGTGDNMAAALGMGLRVGDIAMSLGTSGTAYAVSERPTHDPSGAVAGFCDASGGFLPLVCTLNATRVTDTFANWLGCSVDEFAELALAAPPGSDGVVLVPYFDGERTPNLPGATGTMFGLRNSVTRSDIARAAHEGVVCALIDGIDALASAGAAVGGTLHLVGGGARSAAYRQVAADCWGDPVLVPSVDECVATGACVQAAMQVGLAAAEAAEAWRLGAGEVVEPAVHADDVTVWAKYREAVLTHGVA